MVRVFFRSKTLRNQCRDSTAMDAAWGSECSAVIRRRLQQLAAAESVEDMGFMTWVGAIDGDGRVEVNLEGGLVMDVTIGSSVADGLPRAEWFMVEAIRSTGSNKT